MGTVTDPTGAVIPGAETCVSTGPKTCLGLAPERDSDKHGNFQLQTAPGQYFLWVKAPGFAVYTSETLHLEANTKIRVPVRLSVASLHQEVSVLDDQSTGLGSHASSALVFEGDKLELLSNDKATLEQQLNALAGGMGTPSFLIDGFSGAHLPPKASIRSIRIEENPYADSFSEYGFGRVEVSTKPGTEHLHGYLALSGTERSLDARNPYTDVQPPFYDFQEDANVNGPLNRKTSFFLADTVEQLANNAVVNAADPLMPTTQVSTAVPSPQNSQTYSVRVDRQFSERNFAYLRDEWSRTQVENSGISPLVLPSAAFRLSTLTNALQIADTQVLSEHAVNEARFQYQRTRLQQDPNSTSPALVVQGSFQGGGSPVQALRDNQDAFEVQDTFEMDRGKHSLHAGFRFRALRDANRSSAGFNGQYIFPDVASYEAGNASQYSQTFGRQDAVLTTTDLGVFAGDDWKLSRDFTLSYGLRFESQSAIPDHADPAPRAAFAWAVQPGKRSTPLFTVRGGYGLFYTRFPAAQLLQSIRQNGTREVAYVAQNTGFNREGPPPDVVLSGGQPTTYQVNPRLRSPYTQIGSLSVSRSFGRLGSASANLLYEHDSHEFLTRNRNAPLPGTTDPLNPGIGLRPYGDANLYQFSSDANANLEGFYMNYHLQVSPRIFAFGVYRVLKSYSESDGIEHFPSNEYDLRQDYGRSSVNRTQQFTGGFQWVLPHAVTVMPFLDAHTGAPFDITTGTDLNGDTIYNDRPALGGGGLGSVVPTAFGTFNVTPTTGQAALPRNYGTGPGYVWLQLQVNKDFHLGPRPQGEASAAGKPAAVPDRPWDLNFAVEIQNLTNHNNPGLPIGVLSAQSCGVISSAAGRNCAAAEQGSCLSVPSAYFGRSLSLASDFSPITASNRTILLQTTFTF